MVLIWGSLLAPVPTQKLRGKGILEVTLECDELRVVCGSWGQGSYKERNFVLDQFRSYR